MKEFTSLVSPSTLKSPPKSTRKLSQKRCFQAGFAETTGGRLMLKQGMVLVGDMNDLIDFILQENLVLLL